VDVKKSVRADQIICLCGKSPHDGPQADASPMVSQNYAKASSALAKKLCLWRKVLAESQHANQHAETWRASMEQR
jgi:predicted transcriptional regulator